MFCSQFDPNLTQIPWTRTWCFKRSEEIFVGINLLTFMRAKPQEWLKFLNVCDDIDLKYQCLSNKMEQYLKSMDPWFIRSQKCYTYFTAFKQCLSK